MYTRKVPFLGTFKRIETAYASLFCLLSVYTVINQLHIQSILWSERRVSNPQPPAWKAGALPIELLSLNLALIKFTIDKCKYSSGDRRIRTSEVETTDLQSVPFGHSGISPFFNKKSRRRDSNPRPTDYKSVALPAELLRLNILILKNVPFYWGCKFSNYFCCCKKKYNFFWFFSKINSFLSYK